MIPRQTTLRLLALMAAAGSASPLWSQTAESPAAPSPAPVAPPAAAEEVVTLDALEVNEVPIEENILPTSRPLNSVFGSDQAITDIPRNATIISREQLSAISIKDVRDFAKLTSSSYTRSNFGAPGNPDIRGQYADVFTNGMRSRITSNGNGMPIDFNSVESVNIVKGPATAIQGASAYVGGFVDLVTKRPTFDAQKGETSVTVGSYNLLRWTLDYNVPVNEELATRFSYSGEDSDGGYYSDQYTKTQSLYGAATWKPNEKYELFVNSSFSYMEYTENIGSNRPTDEFIKNGLYQTGVNANGPATDPQNSTNVLAGGNTMAWGPQVKLSDHNRLLKPGDNSIARNYNLQAIQSVDADPDLKVVNNNLFTWTRRDTHSSYAYTEIIDPSITFESRLEFQKTLGDHFVNSGVAGRYTSVEAYNDYFYEPAGVWDLSQDHAFIDVTSSTDFQSGLNIPGFRGPVPGYPGRWAVSGLVNGDTNKSTSLQASPFVQSRWKLAEPLTFVAGGRADFLHVESMDPISDSPDNTGDVVLPNVNTSLVYKLKPAASVYVTYNYSRNTAGALANGGGFSPGFTEEDLQQPSTLYELGTKWSLLDSKLFLGAAVYDQSRTVKPIGSAGEVYHYQGVELEMNYQPNRNFYGTLSYGFIHAEAAAAGFEAISTDIGTIHPEVQSANFAPDLRVQGLPKHQFNALAAYKWDNGFGASVNGTLHSEINNNWAGTLVIPWQFEIDTSVFYERNRWLYKLAALNVTDERNLAPPNSVYGNESILVEEGIRFEFTVGYRF